MVSPSRENDPHAPDMILLPKKDMGSAMRLEERRRSSKGQSAKEITGTTKTFPTCTQRSLPGDWASNPTFGSS